MSYPAIWQFILQFLCLLHTYTVIYCHRRHHFWLHDLECVVSLRTSNLQVHWAFLGHVDSSSQYQIVGLEVVFIYVIRGCPDCIVCSIGNAVNIFLTLTLSSKRESARGWIVEVMRGCLDMCCILTSGWTDVLWWSTNLHKHHFLSLSLLHVSMYYTVKLEVRMCFTV